MNDVYVLETIYEGLASYTSRPSFATCCPATITDTTLSLSAALSVASVSSYDYLVAQFSDKVYRVVSSDDGQTFSWRKPLVASYTLVTLTSDPMSSASLYITGGPPCDVSISLTVDSTTEQNQGINVTSHASVMDQVQGSIYVESQDADRHTGLKQTLIALNQVKEVLRGELPCPAFPIQYPSVEIVSDTEKQNVKRSTSYARITYTVRNTV